ncbi:MAG: hypothetical protein U1E76_14540 [Planctomycetota bacterium]
MSAALKIGLTLAVGVAGIALGIWMMPVDEREEPRAHSPSPRPTPSILPAPRPPPQGAAAAIERRLIPMPPAPALAQRRDVPLDSVAGEGEPVPVAGRLIVIDQGGKEHAQESGSFALERYQKHSSSRRSIEVTRGQWSAPMLQDVRYQVADVMAADRPAVVIGDADLVLPADRSLVIRARWLPTTVLEVVDALSGEPLTGVTVVAGESEQRPSLQAADPHRYAPSVVTLVRDAASPISIDLESWSAIKAASHVWSHAPLHAWTEIHIDWTRGGAYRLALERSAQLEVQIVNADAIDRREPPLEDVKLHVRSLDLDQLAADVADALADRQRYQSLPLTDREIRERLARSWDSFADSVLPDDVLVVDPQSPGPTLMDDAPLGSFVVTLEAEQNFRQLLLGEARVELHEGQRAAVTIEVRDPRVETPATQVPLSGTLFLHPAWGRTAVNLTIPGAGKNRDLVIPSARMQALGKQGLFRWDAGLVAPGLYVAYLSGCGANFTFDVGAEGRTDLDLIIDEPALARVRVTDASGQAVPARTVQWSSGVPGVDMGGSADWNASEQVFELRAPVGPIQLNVTGDPERHQELEQLVELHAGASIITLTLAPPMGILLDVTDGGTAIALDVFDCWRFVVRKQEPGAPPLPYVTTPDVESTSYRILVPSAGTWQVSLPRTRCYEAASIEVEVPEGGFTRQRVALVRRPRR